MELLLQRIMVCIKWRLNERQIRRMLLLALFCIAQLVFFCSYVFTIRHISVTGNTIVPTNFIVEQTSMQIGEQFWSYIGVASRLKALPQIDDASVAFSPGGIVSVVVKERKAIAQIATLDKDFPWVCVDDKGVVLGISNPAIKLPKIRLCYPVRILKSKYPVANMDRVSAEPIKRFLAVHNMCEKLFGNDLIDYEFDKSQMLSANVRVLNATASILIGEGHRFLDKEKAIAGLLITIRKQGKPIKKIDARYDNLVVTFVNPPKSKNNSEKDDNADNGGNSGEDSSEATGNVDSENADRSEDDSSQLGETYEPSSETEDNYGSSDITEEYTSEPYAISESGDIPTESASEQAEEYYGRHVEPNAEPEQSAPDLEIESAPDGLGDEALSDVAPAPVPEIVY